MSAQGASIPVAVMPPALMQVFTRMESSARGGTWPGGPGCPPAAIVCLPVFERIPLRHERLRTVAKRGYVPRPGAAGSGSPGPAAVTLSTADARAKIRGRRGHRSPLRPRLFSGSSQISMQPREAVIPRQVGAADNRIDEEPSLLRVLRVSRSFPRSGIRVKPRRARAGRSPARNAPARCGGAGSACPSSAGGRCPPSCGSAPAARRSRWS
jgi:hypothetical protein